MRRRRRRSDAFTLIELLAVVGILALVVALLMPMLGRATDLARQAKCMTNQRNIVNAVHAYAAENRYFPYNYTWYWPYRGANERWALGCISPYLAGGSPDQVDLRNRTEGEFPADYVCPSADLRLVYLYNPSDMYHACYWTNICIRINRGFGGTSGKLFDTYGHAGQPPGWDHGSGGASRISGRACSRCRNWRSIYQPTLSSLPLPEKTMFSGDTNDVPHTNYSGTIDPGEWRLTPGWWTGAQGQLGFRHMDDNMVVSYLDGHVRPFARSELDNYSRRSDGETRGDFLIQYTDNYVCEPWRIHKLPNMVVE